MKKIKILILSTNADLAGAPLHVKELALSLKRDGHQVVVVFGSNGLTQKALHDLDVNTHVVQGLRSAINPMLDIRVYQRLMQIVKAEQPHLIHCHSAKAGILGRLVAARLKVPCVYTVHGWGFGSGRKPIIGFILRCLEHYLKWITSHFIAVSESDRQVGISRLGIGIDGITTIRNGINSAVSQPELRPIEPKIIMVARNDFQKDYFTLARALAQVDGISAVVVGSGTDAVDFRSEMNSLAKDNCLIEFCGVRTDVAALLESSSIFVLSSRYEALPLSIIEAMSKGLPIVASDVGGVSELVSHGLNGYLFPAGDHLMLAKYIYILKENIDLRHRMGKESIRRYRSELSSDRMMNQTYNVYQKVLGMQVK
jgi:glycosyltransferase involved in cell wall biosynthesis